MAALLSTFQSKYSTFLSIHDQIACKIKMYLGSRKKQKKTFTESGVA